MVGGIDYYWESIGPLQDPVTWYGINYTGTQMTQWDYQNKGKSGWTGKSSFVLKVPLRYLRLSVIYSVPCDGILQRAYSLCLHSLRASPQRRGRVQQGGGQGQPQQVGISFFYTFQMPCSHLKLSQSATPQFLFTYKGLATIFYLQHVEAKKVTVKLLRLKGHNSSTFRSTTYSKAI